MNDAAAVRVKICGVNSPFALDAAVSAGADMLGFVFFPPSPRALSPTDAAALARLGTAEAERVGLFVDPDDATIEAVLSALPLDVIQLHGSETPERCTAIRASFGRPVMKALGVASPSDLDALSAYAPCVDRFLLDAKPPAGAELPGGNAAAFDWRLLSGRAVPRPWLLAGGLTPGNVAQAVGESGAPGVDVSSGVEKPRGVKDTALIRAFVAAAKG